GQAREIERQARVLATAETGAAVGLRHRLDVMGPLPERADRRATEHHRVELDLLGGPTLVVHGEGQSIRGIRIEAGRGDERDLRGSGRPEDGVHQPALLADLPQEAPARPAECERREGGGERGRTPEPRSVPALGGCRSWGAAVLLLGRCRWCGTGALGQRLEDRRRNRPPGLPVTLHARGIAPASCPAPEVPTRRSFSPLTDTRARAGTPRSVLAR